MGAASRSGTRRPPKFFINLADNGASTVAWRRRGTNRHAVFGRVPSGMDVVDKKCRAAIGAGAHAGCLAANAGPIEKIHILAGFPSPAPAAATPRQ